MNTFGPQGHTDGIFYLPSPIWVALSSLAQAAQMRLHCAAACLVLCQKFCRGRRWRYLLCPAFSSHYTFVNIKRNDMPKEIISYGILSPS